MVNSKSEKNCLSEIFSRNMKFSSFCIVYTIEGGEATMQAHTQDDREGELIRLMQLYGDSVKRMCCVYLRDMPSAEDAAQETFIKAFEHLDALLDGEIHSEKAWLMRIAVNTCKDMLRSSWMRHIDRHKTIEELPLSVAPGHEDRLALAQALSALPPKLKEIVLLHDYEGLNLRTCAQILNVSAPTATRRLAQAYKKLRIEWERS